jgi:hypothetical protein
VRRFTSSSLSLVAAVALAAGLVGCGNDDDTAAVDEAAPPTTAIDDTTTTPVDDTGGAPDAEGPAGGGDAQQGQRVVGCERLDVSPDGVYVVSDAGEIEIAHDGATVRLVEARPAEGWTATGDTEDDDDEVEVYFRRDGREVEFEAEVDDGRLEVDVCED